MFQFKNLQKLYNDMKNKNEIRAIFQFSFNSKKFSCIFLTDIYPYQLSLTPIGSSNLVFEFEIDNNYKTNSYIDTYKNLITYLGLHYNPNYSFKPNDFFAALDKKIPTNFTTSPRYNQVLKNKLKNMKNSEKIYFCGWKKSPTGRVSKENLEKTKQAFGDKYVKISKKYGISSCWSSDKNKEDLDKLDYNSRD